MNRVFYEVAATIADQSMADDWVRWMLDEHMREVIAAGATSARLIRLDDSALGYLTQYEFPSRAVFEHYLAVHAPRLREEGSRRFEPDQVSYVRRAGEIVGH